MDWLLELKLKALANALIDQAKAKLVIPPHRGEAGFWFGSGNMLAQPDGSFLLVGRYRHDGDSRRGAAPHERGVELAVFQAPSPLGPFEKIVSLDKQQLAAGGGAEVLSIEGASLYLGNNGVELFVSSEKRVPYPPGLEMYQKPGTGVWSIDVLRGRSLASLAGADVVPVLKSEDPPFLHVKDPMVFTSPEGNDAMVYCSHPFTWTSTNAGLALRESGETWFYKVTDNMFPRGFVWDVAAIRITSRLPVPPLGMFASLPEISLYFYDGAECMRKLDDHPTAMHRPRGYSCEEIGGLAAGYDDTFPELERLSIDAPMFVSPHGTGCSRYVSTLVTSDSLVATWQQSQPDGSQALVGHTLPLEVAEKLLGS